MNKMIKGSVAGATGVALLMGGFGTYALWSDSENLAANGVQSGELTIDTTAGEWDDVNSAAANDWNGATDKMVPRDKVSYTQTFTVNGEGKNLRGTITLGAQNLTSGFGAGNLVRTVAVDVSGAGAADITKVDDSNFTFASPFDTATLTAVVTYEFKSSVTDTTDQNKAASVPAVNFVIAQS